MTTEQTSSNAAIAQAVVKAAREAIQAMTTAEAERSQKFGPKLGGSIVEQLTFDWNPTGK